MSVTTYREKRGRTMKTTYISIIAAILLSASLAYAGVVQVGDFRIGSSVYTVNTYFDPGFSETTRGVSGAPVQIVSAFTGTSQEAGRGTTGVDDSDIGLRTYSSTTQILSMQRYGADPDGPGPSGGPQRLGIVQWNFDLTPLDSYLSGNGLTLTALDMDLVLDLPGGDGYDVYLSYTDAGAGTTLTGISTTSGADNYNNFWWAAESAGATAGSIVNGQFEVIVRDQVADGTVSDSLLALYNNGVREFNLTLMTPDYNKGQQTKITDGSGISFTAIPEPGTLGLVGAFGATIIFLRKRFRN
jgi:hypothetical protein